ncbi:hypothetical protein SFC07_09055 [Corynebacterium callunae]|uniref:hypothetical protein n=1 Tax=Corynebacterium callunae TaxID=1721 RepID=UPI003981E0B5
MKVSDSRHISVLSSASAATIYNRARSLPQLPSWASGLAAGNLLLIDENQVELDSPMGRVRTIFTPRNDLGILDHTVILPDGQEVLNPFRVIDHPLGSELIFSVRQGESSAEAFEADCQAVHADLERLVNLAEGEN